MLLRDNWEECLVKIHAMDNVAGCSPQAQSCKHSGMQMLVEHMNAQVSRWVFPGIAPFLKLSWDPGIARDLLLRAGGQEI